MADLGLPSPDFGGSLDGRMVALLLHVRSEPPVMRPSSPRADQDLDEAPTLMRLFPVKDSLFHLRCLLRT
eukprot:895551-Prorocentrum_lima.AAC.1